MFSIPNRKPRTFNDVKVFAGDQDADVSFRNLFWENLPAPDELFHVYTPAIVSVQIFFYFTEPIFFFQVTMPRYRENRLIRPFSMLCPGISQNTKHHHLTLYKGQVWRSKSYLNLCDDNILKIAYHRFRLRG